MEMLATMLEECQGNQMHWYFSSMIDSIERKAPLDLFNAITRIYFQSFKPVIRSKYLFLFGETANWINTAH